MVAIVAAGRCGSAFAAEIGTMKIAEELDALTTMGINPVRFLVVPKVIAMLAAVPALTVMGDVLGIVGGLIVSNLELAMPVSQYMQITQDEVSLKYFFEGLSKSFFFAAEIAVVGAWCGFNTGSDSVAVGRSTTKAVVIGILLIIFTDAVMAKIFAVLYGILG